MRPLGVRAYERLVPLVIKEDHAATTLLVKPDDLWRITAVCLLLLDWLSKQSSAQGRRHNQPQHVCGNNSQLQSHLNPLNWIYAASSAITPACATGRTRQPEARI